MANTKTKTHTPSSKQTAVHKTADEVFLDLREAAQKNNVTEVFRLANALPKNYPLYAFGEYWKLKMRQPDVSDAAMRGFIADYDGSFIADRLRNDWLLLLGARGDWKQFDEQYPLFALQDDPQVDCYAVASKVGQGQKVRQQARNVLLRNSSHASGAGCTALLGMLVTTGQFSPDDISEVELIRSETRRTPIVGHTPLHRAMQSAASCAQKLGNDCHWVFRSGNPQGAIIALPDNLQGTGSDSALEWAVRSALRAQDWSLLLALIQRLPTHLSAESTWIYWQARAHLALKQDDLAKPLLEKLKSGWGFYHVLAREQMGLPNMLPPAITPREHDVLLVLSKPEIERMQAFYRMGLRWEGNREWNWMLRGLTDSALSAHAEAGRRLGHYDRMVNTADRSKMQLDFSQRYPMPFFKQARPIAQQLSLDLNWVYGLIRQESRFIAEVRSHVGAQGLMQVMPKTAQWVARRIKMEGFALNKIQEPEINLMLGQSYLAMVLKDLDNQPILATAAYNAGPSRPKAWRASLPKAVEGAIFAETIPFNETRGYVKNVLVNATLYGLVTGQNPKPLTQWLGTVSPKQATDSDLP